MTKPTTVEIDVSQVPEDKRKDSRFLRLLADMQRGCADQRLVHAICIHEAAHVFFLGHAGLDKPTANGPRILYDQVKDQFDGQGSVVSFGAWDQKYIDALDSRDWLGRVAKGYAAGGVAARILANSVDRGDGDDREHFENIFAKIKSSNPSLTWTSDFLWANAQKALELDFKNAEIKDVILQCAEGLKPELFRAAS